MNKIHWFAETKVSKTINYPYFSVDSTTWLTWWSFWLLFLYDKINHKLLQAHYKEKEKIIKNFEYIPKEYRNLKYIIDTDEKQVWYVRNLINVKSFQAMERDMTDIWNARWIVFNN